MSLSLRQLPMLLTDCVLLGHGHKADVVFTPREFFAICAHMMNDNPTHFFLRGWQDKNGKAQYVKAKPFKSDVSKQTEWAWDTITGKAKSAVTLGFYPTNDDNESRWGGMDFDAHDGNFAQAREYARKAFDLLLRQQPQLFVALTTSAGDPERCGFHLFVFTKDFHAREDWTRLLKQVAAQIGAPIQDGVCEIFPNESRGLPKPLRAPATYNPKTGDCGLILHQTLSDCVAALPCGEDKGSNAFYLLSEPPSKSEFSSPSSEFSRGVQARWATEFPITAPGTRHKKLVELVATAFVQAGKSVLRENAEVQYREATPAPKASLDEHLNEFDQEVCPWKEREWKSKLSSRERERLDGLTTEVQRDAFRILRNWSQTDTPDFKIHCDTLGERLGITPRGAGKLRLKFCDLGILHLTARCVPRKLCARFRWTAGDEPKRHQSTLISSQQRNGDPGDARFGRAKK